MRYAAELASSLCLYSVVERNRTRALTLTLTPTLTLTLTLTLTRMGLPPALGFYGTMALGCASLLGCLLPEMSAGSPKTISASRDEAPLL